MGVVVVVVVVSGQETGTENHQVRQECFFQASRAGESLQQDTPPPPPPYQHPTTTSAIYPMVTCQHPAITEEFNPAKRNQEN